MKIIVMLSFGLLSSLAAALFIFSDAPSPTLQPAAERADTILIEPTGKRLTLLREDQVLAKFRVAAPDPATPDACARAGSYEIRQRNPHRLYRLSLGLGGENRSASPKAFIHGAPRLPQAALNLFQNRFTGCIGVGEDAMREIWSRVMIGTDVIIR